MGENRKPRLLLIAYRAFGDWLFTTPILPYLFEKYEVHLECNRKVYALAYDDPRFAGITVFNDTKFIMRANTEKDFDKDKAIREHLQSIADRVKPDRIVDLSFSHERKTVASQEQKEFWYTKEERQSIFGKWNYTEAVFDHIGMKMPEDVKLDALYISPEQETMVKKWRDRHTSDFLVIIPPLGSCMQKFYPYMNDVVQHIVDTYHNAHVYFMGEAGITDGSFNHERIHDMTGKLSIKQSVVMTKYADYVLGPETGLLVAAGMFGTHKTVLCNTCTPKQIGDHKNDHSLQSSWPCSPCHRGIYVEEDCEDVKYAEGIPYSGCVHGWEVEDIKAIIKQVYEERNIYNKFYFDRFSERAQSEIGKKIYDSRWSLIERYCHGNLRLLDYGCASGAFHLSARNGFITNGYDVNPNSPFHGQPEGQVDILTLWDVIEHLHDPKEPIDKLKPKYLFLSTPNLHGGVHFPTWKHNRPEEHLHYFNRRTMSDFLTRLGYDILEVNHEEGEIRDPENPVDIITFAAVKR